MLSAYPVSRNAPQPGTSKLRPFIWSWVWWLEKDFDWARNRKVWRILWQNELADWSSGFEQATVLRRWFVGWCSM